MTDKRADQRPTAHDDDEVFVCPASFTQEALWFLDQVEPGRPTYNIPNAFELRGTIDWAVFQQCVDHLVARHESLRTAFASRDEGPVQVIAPNARALVEHIAVVDAASAENQACRLIATEATTPFDLSQPPLLRVKALSTDPKRHIVTFTFHHIVADGWSMAVFFQEFGQLYNARASGRDAALPPLPIQFADYTIWQRGRLTPELKESQLGYWREALRGGPDTVELPTDRPRPTAASGRGATEWYAIDGEVTSRLRELCRSEQATTFMGVVTLINVLLARHTGQYDLMVGTPMASRIRQELEGAVGFFANTLVLRSVLSPDISFREALRRVRAATLGAYKNADVSFSQVVATVRPERTSAANPLFQVMCAFQNVPNALLEIDGIELQQINTSSGTAKFDLLFEFQERSRHIAASLEYSTDLFDQETIARWIARLQTLTANASRTPDMPIGRLSVLPQDERSLIAQWNDTAVQRAESETVVTGFERQVAQTPSAPAVQCGHVTLTYDVLNQSANRFARFLQRTGVGLADRVGICLDRSVDLAVAVLGVLKAGAAYVPLDPAYPAERLSFMAEDADVKFVLADQNPAAKALPNRKVILDLQECLATANSLSGHNLELPITAATPLFVMYTSGSTGRPKGVVMPHGPLFNLIAWQLTRNEPNLKTAQYGSISFDASFHEIFATWLAGGRLVIVPESSRRQADELLEILQDEGIERIFIPFIGLQLLAETAVARNLFPASLREVQTAGEQLRITPAIRTFFERLNGSPLDNHYGPTEAHVVTAHRLTGSPTDWPELPPIGTPISNARIHLLDAQMQLAPIGAVADLWIGGSCLADGYWRRPELTSERFVVAEIEGRPERLYRSGDRARYLRDGAIDFLGRNDDQVKIRGYRVEPAEIEVALEKHPAVKQAAVVTRKRGSGPVLIAFYVAVEGMQVVHADLGAHLAKHLPDYMIPAAFVALPIFPVTPSGKIARRELPELKALEQVHPKSAAAPTDRVEEQVMSIWQEVLGVPDIGVDDGFFEIGGHSLDAVRVVGRVEKHLGVSVRLSDFFAGPTVKAIAAIVRHRLGTGAATVPTAIQRLKRPQRG